VSDETDLAVAITGPTGTFGAGLVPLLEEDERIGRIVGVARRPFLPSERGWWSMRYQQGDVRDPEALATAFADADVVVHLAFLITGTAGRDATREVNVEGTLNAFRAAAQAGAKRFVYASSVAAYGFHPDNPIGIREEWPVRPAKRLFYAQEKAEVEQLLAEEATAHPELELYLLRPSIVVGPDFIGGKSLAPAWLGPLGSWLNSWLSSRSGIGRLPVPLPVVVPHLELQLVHEADVGRALLQCVLGAGPPGAYNIAADGLVTLADIARAVGALPIEVSEKVSRTAARWAAQAPALPAFAEWVEAASHPAVMDATKAKRELGWTPRFTAIEALQATLSAD
jgi:nucleoside-diphosphate-sugar epimerase